MSERFADMVKVPKHPAARMLADASTKLKTKTEAPASSSVEVVLNELAEKEAWVDILRLLSVVLPPRERVWWACMAGRDFIDPKADKLPRCLTLAEEWVRRPSPENLEQIAVAVDQAERGDETVKCALSAQYADGTLGPGDMSQIPAPPGGSEVMAFVANTVALKSHKEDFNDYIHLLIDRAVDIARGGNGKIEPATASEEG